MSVRKLLTMLAEAEGNVEEMSVAQISEVVARLADIALADPAGFAEAWSKLLARAEERTR